MLPARNANLDGELCGVLPDGRTAFNLTQNASGTGQGSLVFFVFDLPSARDCVRGVISNLHGRRYAWQRIIKRERLQRNTRAPPEVGVQRSVFAIGERIIDAHCAAHVLGHQHAHPVGVDARRRTRSHRLDDQDQVVHRRLFG